MKPSQISSITYHTTLIISSELSIGKPFLSFAAVCRTFQAEYSGMYDSHSFPELQDILDRQKLFDFFVDIGYSGICFLLK